MNAQTGGTAEQPSGSGRFTDEAFDRPFAVTFFPDFQARTRREAQHSLRTLADDIRQTTAARKDQLPWLKLARFGDRPTDKGCLRHDANLLAITGIEADYDGGTMGFAEAVETLLKADVLALVYTSPSHTEDSPRWRVLCPTSTELLPAQREHLLGRLNGLFRGSFSGESWTLSQSYYYGSVRSNPSHQVELVDGTPIDLLSDLDATWCGKPSTTGSGPGGAGDEPRRGRVNEAELLAEIVSGKSYHQAAVRLLGKWARDGVPYMTARARLRDAMEAVFPPDRDARWRTRYEDIDRCLEDIYVKEARARDEGRRPSHAPSGPAGSTSTSNSETGEVSPRFSDDGVALAFSERYEDRLLYVAGWGQWLTWDAKRWDRDDTLKVFDLVRPLCRDMAALASFEEKRGDTIAQGLTSAGTIAAVERLARSDPRHARRPDDFDADPWALNTPAGVVDLRNGLLRPHCRGDLFTKSTSVAPAGRCPRWLRFLLQITRRDKPMVRYLQRFIGYTLTGVISEHAFVFLYGPGGNGKSVLLNTIATALGDYATTAMADVFTVGRTEQHPTHLANLRGARMVLVTETEEGRAWAESRIKALTGGDRISARVMRGDPFEFGPQFKLWIAGNHRPVLRNPDPAMRRRLHLVPLTFVPAKPDPGLPEALRRELPGILAWAVRGCLAWQRDGLAPPAAIQAATNSYFQEQDALSEWLAERCAADPFAETGSRTLFNDWKQWVTERNEEAGTEKRFSEAMERHAAKKHTKRGTVFLGLKLLPSDTGVW